MADEVEVLAPSAGVEEEVVAPPTTAPVEDPITGQPVEGQPANQEELSTEEEPDVEPDLEEVPETSGDFSKYKPLFKENPELRAILGREKAYSEIAPSFSEFKGIMERVPTLDDAEQLSSAADSHRALGESFRSDAVAFAESLRENDPLAYSQFAKKFPEILASTDPSLYTEQARFYSNSVLDNLFESYKNSGNQDALISLQNVAAMLGVQLGGSRLQIAPQGNSEVEKLKQKLAERDQIEANSKGTAFWDGTTKEHLDTSLVEIESLVKKAVPTVTEAQLKRISDEIWEGVNSKLGDQPATVKQINTFKAAVARGKMSVSDHREIVKFAMQRTRQVLPFVAKEVLAVWSKDILAANQAQIEKKKAIAARSQAVSTPVGGTPAAPPKGAQPQRRSFNNIFDSLGKGTYQPAARR